MQSFVDPDYAGLADLMAYGRSSEGRYTRRGRDVGYHIHRPNISRNWGGEIKIDKIIFKPIVDPNTRALSLENGEVDFTVDIPYNEVERISKMSGINVEIFENSRTYLLSLNMNHVPLDDERVRKAIAYTIDKDSIVDHVLFKAGKSANGVFRPDLY
jgi:peptide/nickel transport system substrate-binding protein